MKLNSTKNLASAIHEATHGKSGTELSKALENVVEFMNKNRLLSKSKDILAQLEKVIDKEEGVLRVKVKSADVLPSKMISELESNLKKRYSAKKIEIDNIKDESVIDGIKIETGDEVIDLSLSKRLSQLQDHLIKN